MCYFRMGKASEDIVFVILKDETANGFSENCCLMVGKLNSLGLLSGLRERGFPSQPCRLLEGGETLLCRNIVAHDKIGLWYSKETTRAGARFSLQLFKIAV